LAVPLFTVGQVLTAALVNSWLAPIAAYKASDESVTSSTVLQNDNDLVVAVAASCTYMLDLYVNYEGGTQGSSDLKLGWTVPAGTTVTWGHIGVNTVGTITQASVATTSDQTNTPSFGTNGAGNALSAFIRGTVLVSSTAGNLQLQWAQVTSSGTATKVKAGSYMLLQRIA
jgi:hypothetical protein